MMPTLKAIHRKIDEYNMEEGMCISAFSAHFLTFYKVLDLVFPDDLRESNPSAFKFLKMAQAWKAKGSLFQAPAQTTLSTTVHESAASSDAEMEDGDGDKDEDEGEGENA